MQIVRRSMPSYLIELFDKRKMEQQPRRGMRHDFDKKQQQIILSWLSRAGELEGDDYAAFISVWISFNAYCYGRFALEANRRRANLCSDKGLRTIGPEPIPAVGVVYSDPAKIRIELNQPGRIVIDLVERYTEDIIYSEFVKAFQSNYIKWLENPDFFRSVQEFRNALQKEDSRHYVINMVRISKYREYVENKLDFDTIARRNVVVPFEDINSLSELKNALYQVRCNVFHGEKVPGNVNDDHIVSTAYFPLRQIMEKLSHDFSISC